MANGICKLTLKEGKFVKAHIIPKALTYPEKPGLPFIQGGSGMRAKKRWSSWYDPELVTREGEDILEDLDTWAITFLRSRQLVWSGWGGMLVLPVQNIGVPYWGIRTIDVPEAAKFRRFLLSLLWRAAASNMFEFKEVELPKQHLERLRKAVVGPNEEREDFFPAALVQLSTMGVTHNLGPIAQTKIIPAIGREPELEIPIFRFYFDGLIVHFHNQVRDNGHTKKLGEQVVGFGEKLTLTTVTFEASFQYENLKNVWSETIHV